MKKLNFETIVRFFVICSLLGVFPSIPQRANAEKLKPLPPFFSGSAQGFFKVVALQSAAKKVDPACKDLTNKLFGKSKRISGSLSVSLSANSASFEIKTVAPFVRDYNFVAELNKDTQGATGAEFSAKSVLSSSIEAAKEQFVITTSEDASIKPDSTGVNVSLIISETLKKKRGFSNFCSVSLQSRFVYKKLS